MSKFKGLNMLDHNSKLKTPALTLMGVILLASAFLLFYRAANKTGATATLDNYKIKLVYEVTWDNYCLNPKLEVTNLKSRSRTEVKINSYQGPCGHNHPSSFWMKTGDFNHDGHMDFSVLSLYDVSNDTVGPAYTNFIYTPSAPVAMPFLQQ